MPRGKGTLSYIDVQPGFTSDVEDIYHNYSKDSDLSFSFHK